ncbi:MAG: hypothetical protein HQ464_05930, partial [Planctomycetes bacterium]|nr:hypothetical protein [Planctomycetota bacterium]
MAETVCVACGMRFQQPIDDLEGWLFAHLEPAPGARVAPAKRLTVQFAQLVGVLVDGGVRAQPVVRAGQPA